jgi:hypothetical protein
MTFPAAMDSVTLRQPSRLEGRLMFAFFAACLVFHFWGVQVGWQSKNLPGGEFRQAQTALSAYWIKAENNFSLAYPTPVVGKPWSIPMEFPLYQWVVVVTGKLTGWGLTKAGRAVSIACFYLCLPALFLLLRRWDVPPVRRWLVLAAVLSCPLYIFYARAFLIETMALMFSLWFWVAFERAVAERSKAWLALAVLAGTGAGLVKVTTFMLYLLPAAWWAGARLWAARRNGWWRELAWMAAAIVVPFAATLWWLNFADATKALNPLGIAFTSSGLREFNLGTSATRFSSALWAVKAQIVTNQLTWWPALLVCAVITVVVGRARWRQILACIVWFGSVLVIFPVLYAYHDYYYVANALLLTVAVGLALVVLTETGIKRVLVYGVVLLVLGGQARRYLEHYYPGQSAISPGGDGLTRSLQFMTNPSDVIVVLGQDWNSMTAYYSQRKAVMFRDDVARDSERVERVLAKLDGETIGALVVVGEPDGAKWLIDRAAVRGISPEPLYVWHDARVYLPQARRTELLNALLDNAFHEVQLAPGIEVPREDLSARWIEVATLRRREQNAFVGMQPRPVRFFASFGPGMDGSSGHPMYGAHPVTRLVFALPAGHHTLRSSLQMKLEAYRTDLPDWDTTDGVEVSLFALGKNDERRLLATRLFNPRHNRDDRGNLRPLEFEFALEAPGEIELFFGPGAAGRDTRDWIELGPLTINPSSEAGMATKSTKNAKTETSNQP